MAEEYRTSDLPSVNFLRRGLASRISSRIPSSPPHPSPQPRGSERRAPRHGRASTYRDRSWATRRWEAGTATGHREGAPSAAGCSQRRSLLSPAKGSHRHGDEILILSDLGPDWLGRQDKTVLVSSSSFKLKGKLGPSVKVSSRSRVQQYSKYRQLMASQATEAARIQGGYVRSRVPVDKKRTSRARGGEGTEIRRRVEQPRQHFRPQS